MFEREIIRYDTLLKEYRQQVVDRFNTEDLEEYNEILFSAHSCAIKGNTFSVGDTRVSKEKGLGLILQGKTLLEAFEMLDHFKAHELLMEQAGQPLIKQLVKDTHRILVKHTLTYRYRDAVPGECTNTDTGAGDTIFGNHKELVTCVLKLMEATQETIEERPMHPVEIATRFHEHFVLLHPFRDGNGRLDRLLSNFILVKLEQPMILIKGTERGKCIAALKACRNEHNTAPVVDLFFNTAIKRMENKITLKKEMTEENDLDYSI